MSNQNRENKEISEQELSLETLDDQIKQIEEEMQIKRIKLNAFKKERKKNLYKNAKKTKFVCSVCGKSLADKAALNVINFINKPKKCTWLTQIHLIPNSIFVNTL